MSTRFIRANSAAYLDAIGVTGNIRARALALELPHSGKPAPKSRAWSQAALDAQPVKKAAARVRKQIAEAKARALAPLRPSRPQADMSDQPLFGGLAA